MNIMENNDKYVNHFGISINCDKINLRINRENYAKIDKKNHSISTARKLHKKMEVYKNSNNDFERRVSKNYFENYLKVYEDERLETYTDEWCKKHQEECLTNYDLNMAFFDKIKYEDFEKAIKKFKNRYKKFVEVTDLSSYEGKSGIYILVLDNYKQVYVGQTNDIKKRVSQHWKNKKEFSKLVFGKVEDSILSIDSFGPLDTTRIYVYETYSMYSKFDMEEKMTTYFPRTYLLNRTAGGDRGEFFNEIVINTLGTRNKRQLI